MNDEKNTSIKKVIFPIVKIIAVTLGFFGALSLVRSRSTSFNWHMNFIYGEWLNFGLETSLVLLGICMVALTYSIWHTKKPSVHLPLRKLDYALLVLFCVVGFYVCYYLLRDIMLTPWEISRGLGSQAFAAITYPPRNLPSEVFLTVNLAHFRSYLIPLPIIAYASAMLVYVELIARLRDKTLIQTLYWVAFFKAYRLRPIGIFAILLLASQLFLFLYYPLIPIRIFSFFTICMLTYFSVFLRTLSAQYDKSNEDKIRSERFKSELITNVSHDIKTPLTSIINYVNLLNGLPLQGDAANYAAVLHKKSDRLKILIDDLMEASKAGTGNVSVNMQEINLGEIIGQIAGEFDDAFAERNLTLVFRQPDSPVFIRADPRHLWRALENLFSNASKYSLPDTRVFAEITLNNDKPMFSIKNTSADPIELSGEDLSGQFIRGDRARQTEGNGLGLYIAKSLVELMSGTFTIRISGDLFEVEILFDAFEA